MLRGLLALQGCKVGRRHVAERWCERRGKGAIYRRVRHHQPRAGQQIHPYLLRGLGDYASKPGFWAKTFTYIPMAHGFVYLAVVPTGDTSVLSWRLSITMEAAFCVGRWKISRVSRQAGHLQHRPGSQFTGAAFTRRPRRSTDRAHGRSRFALSNPALVSASF